jgi:hypothetical protein
MKRQKLWPAHQVEFNYPLAPEDIAMQRMYANFTILLSGIIDEERLITACHTVLARYHFFYGEFANEKGTLHLTCRYSPVRPVDRSGVMPVLFETDVRAEAIGSSDASGLYDADFVASLAPSKPAVIGDRRALLQIRLCQFSDASTLGVVWNHALSDLHGIYGFLQEVGQAYNNVPGSHFPLFDRKKIWSNLPEAQFAANVPVDREGRHGIVSISRIKAALGIVRYLLSNAFDSLPVCLLLNGKLLRATQQDAAVRGIIVSRNDLINASLMKLHVAALDEARAPPEIALYFPVNLRPLLRLDSKVVGNCLGNVCMSLRRETIASSSLVELAGVIRDARVGLDPEQVSKDRSWLEYWKTRCSPHAVYHHWLLGRHRVYSSNWLDDKLTELSFGPALFRMMLRSPLIAAGFRLPNFHSTILPRVTENGTEPVVRLSVSKRQLDALMSQPDLVPFISHVAVSNMRTSTHPPRSFKQPLKES